MRVVGVIPAAGLSKRMGRPKLALPLGGSTVLERVIAAVRDGGVEHVLVVLGPTSSRLRDSAERAGASALALDRETPDMRTTVLAGLDHVARTTPLDADDAWLLLPADHPTLDPAVVRTLIQTADQDRVHSIFVPTYAGQRGHPTLLRWSHAAALHELPEGQGLNAYIRGHAAQTREIAWSSAEVLRDLDTPDDYKQLHGHRCFIRPV
jgi:molybdenum cofactor cytidylyltransferase